MKPVYKVAIVAGGYLLAFFVACAAVAIHAAISGESNSQASSGMAAFGDMILLAVTFGVIALIPTAMAFFFFFSKRKRPMGCFTLRTVKLTGKVGSGKGDFAQWIAKLSEHYERKTGLRLFPGTLNIDLDHEYRLPENPIRLEGAEYGGTVGVNLVPCTIFGRRAFILRTDASEAGTGDHSRHVVEIATDIKLRDAYGLTDGSIVTVEL